MNWIHDDDKAFTKANTKRWKKERELNHRSALDQISQEEGVRFNSVSEICNYVHEQLDKHLVCKKCGLQCATFAKLSIHQDSQRCKKRVCEKNGEVWIPDAQTRIECPFCKVGIRKNYWPAHERTEKHIDNVKLFYLKRSKHYCKICDKDFAYKRDNKTINKHKCRDFKRHLESVKHLKLLQESAKHLKLVQKTQGDYLLSLTRGC